jgi:hypothetical protein
MVIISNNPKTGDLYYSVHVSIGNKKIGSLDLESIIYLKKSMLLKKCKKTDQIFHKSVIDDSEDVFEFYKSFGYTVTFVRHIY